MKRRRKFALLTFPTPPEAPQETDAPELRRIIEDVAYLNKYRPGVLAFLADVTSGLVDAAHRAASK